MQRIDTKGVGFTVHSSLTLTCLASVFTAHTAMFFPRMFRLLSHRIS